MQLGRTSYYHRRFEGRLGFPKEQESHKHKSVREPSSLLCSLGQETVFVPHTKWLLIPAAIKQEVQIFQDVWNILRGSWIQSSKQEKSNLHVVWLDLNNAYGSVPQKLIQSVFMSLNQSSPWYRLLLQRLPGVFHPPGLCSRTSPIGSTFCFGVFHHPSSFHCSL